MIPSADPPVTGAHLDAARREVLAALLRERAGHLAAARAIDGAIAVLQKMKVTQDRRPALLGWRGDRTLVAALRAAAWHEASGTTQHRAADPGEWSEGTL